MTRQRVARTWNNDSLLRGDVLHLIIEGFVQSLAKSAKKLAKNLNVFRLLFEYYLKHLVKFFLLTVFKISPCYEVYFGNFNSAFIARMFSGDRLKTRKEKDLSFIGLLLLATAG